MSRLGGLALHDGLAMKAPLGQRFGTVPARGEQFSGKANSWR
jgi:hypothetical protein